MYRQQLGTTHFGATARSSATSVCVKDRVTADTVQSLLESSFKLTLMLCLLLLAVGGLLYQKWYLESLYRKELPLESNKYPVCAPMWINKGD